jgi:hypothetical protein
VVWVTELKRTIGYYEKTKIFGAPLSRLCDTKSGVPAIVERLAAHLEAAKGSLSLRFFLTFVLSSLFFVRSDPATFFVFLTPIRSQQPTR